MSQLFFPVEKYLYWYSYQLHVSHATIKNGQSNETPNVSLEVDFVGHFWDLWTAAYIALTPTAKWTKAYSQVD